MYRCITCGSDLQQHVNGKISYIPTITNRTPKSQVEDISMAKKAKGLYAKVAHVPTFHKTSILDEILAKQKMNKSNRKNFKKYRGQGGVDNILKIYILSYRKETYVYINTK